LPAGATGKYVVPQAYDCSLRSPGLLDPLPADTHYRQRQKMAKNLRASVQNFFFDFLYLQITKCANYMSHKIALNLIG
jgi:hypothetical protein